MLRTSVFNISSSKGVLYDKYTKVHGVMQSAQNLDFSALPGICIDRILKLMGQAFSNVFINKIFNQWIDPVQNGCIWQV